MIKLTELIISNEKKKRKCGITTVSHWHCAQSNNDNNRIRRIKRCYFHTKRERHHWLCHWKFEKYNCLTFSSVFAISIAQIWTHIYGNVWCTYSHYSLPIPCTLSSTLCSNISTEIQNINSKLSTWLRWYYTALDAHKHTRERVIDAAGRN